MEKARKIFRLIVRKIVDFTCYLLAGVLIVLFFVSLIFLTVMTFIICIVWAVGYAVLSAAGWSLIGIVLAGIGVFCLLLDMQDFWQKCKQKARNLVRQPLEVYNNYMRLILLNLLPY